jgi:ribosomal protein S18 acetylase RimI-like enzyme
MKELKIEKAIQNDHLILTKITKKSKAYWGYSESQMLLWQNNLTISETYIEENATFKLVFNNNIIGYYSYIIKDQIIKLDNLFVLPDYIGQGFGKYLMNNFFDRIKLSNYKKVTLNSEPNAENFYKKLGFNKVGEFETSIKNRFMPIMEINLKI